MNVLTLLCFAVWIYLLTVFHRGGLHYFKFIWGSVGLFVFMFLWIQPIAIEPLSRLVVMATGVLGDLTKLFESNYQYSFMFIETGKESVSLYINYECSGIVEMLAFVSMLMFYQVYPVGQRIMISLLGCIWIFASNVIRLVTICLMTYAGGSDVYYIAHTIVGRLVFYALMIILYYYVFTRSQIIRQKIGGFRYA